MNRKYLKSRAKNTLRNNYFLALVVTLILVFFGGGNSFSISFNMNGIENLVSKEISVDNSENDLSSIFKSSSGNDLIKSMSDDDFPKEGSLDIDISDSSKNNEDYNFFKEDKSDYLDIKGINTILGVTFAIMLVCFIVASVYNIFVANVIHVGCLSYYNTVSEGNMGSLDCLVKPFRSYLHVVGVMFVRNVLILLGTLCFLIPGIIMSYQYLLVPYILADNPTISRRDAFRLSKRMMKGHKMEAFVLGLSFIGWILLSACTCGVLTIFYVNPYMQLTFDEMYQWLKLEYNGYGNYNNQQNYYQNNYNNHQGYYQNPQGYGNQQGYYQNQQGYNNQGYGNQQNF